MEEEKGIEGTSLPKNVKNQKSTSLVIIPPKRNERGPNDPIPVLVPLEKLLEDDSDSDDGEGDTVKSHSARGGSESDGCDDWAEEEPTLACDICGENCYPEQYFVEESEEDYCMRCYRETEFYIKELGEHRMRGEYVYLQSDRDIVRQLLYKDMIHEIEQWELHPDLFEAARKGLMESLKFNIVRKKVDINMLDFGGNTALHIACMLRREEVIRFLLDNGADISIRDSLNRKALDIIRDPVLKRDMNRFAWECTPEGRIHVR